ncbi:MAG TPA: response regulator [Chroococcales cyanobacterium]
MIEEQPHIIQLLIVEPNQSMSESLSEQIGKISGLNLTAAVKTRTEAITNLLGKRIDVVLLDCSVAEIEPLGLIKQIKSMRLGTRVLAYTSSTDSDVILNSLDAGADGYVLVANLPTALETAVRSVRLGAVWLDPAIARQVLEVAQIAAARDPIRELPTGILPLPLSTDELFLLKEVAESSCKDGVCMVDSNFLAKLKRFSTEERAQTL